MYYALCVIIIIISSSSIMSRSSSSSSSISPALRAWPRPRGPRRPIIISMKYTQLDINDMV